MNFRKMLLVSLAALIVFYIFREPDPPPDYQKKFSESIETVLKLENQERMRQNEAPIERKETGIKVSDDGDWTGLNYIMMCREQRRTRNHRSTVFINSRGTDTSGLKTRRLSTGNSKR